MEAASHVRGDADLPHLPQAVENLADVIGPGRNGNGLERSELAHAAGVEKDLVERSEEHTSELQSLMRISYAVFCLKKKKYTTKRIQEQTQPTILPTLHQIT